MQRIPSAPRPNWQAAVESQGLSFHTPDGRPYWDESAYYRFSAAEIDAIEAATYALNDLCLAAADHIFENDRLGLFGVPPAFHEWVHRSWDRDEFTLYGRFDLAWDGAGPPRLLEHNADTPTSLLEAAVVQWQWMQDLHPEKDQFNSLHERLIEAWRSYAPQVDGTMFFASLAGDAEDYVTVNYIRDTAIQAGLSTEYIEIDRIGWNYDRSQFVDLRENPVRHCFKLYPWEWMSQETFANGLAYDTVRWLEAPWKMVLSNKAILAVLWELFPGHPNLLPAAMEPIPGSYVKKPVQSREGSNITVVENGRVTHQTAGFYEGGPFVYQQLHPLPTFAGNRPVLGSWMVNGYACGLGVREDDTPVTGNLSRFVPHVLE